VIVEALQPLAVSINTVRPSTKNPRRGDVEGVMRSLERFGQRKPVVARDDGEIIAGNHTHAAAVSLGWDEIAVVWVEESEAESKAYGIADNRTSDLARYDHQTLAEVMQEVAAESIELLEAASFTQSDLDDLLRFLDPDKPDHEPGDLDDQMPGGEDHVVCPECGHIF
jgi:ParB-like chromosome segregation protein Spo0J